MLCASIVISASAFLAKKPVKAVDRGFLSYTPSQADIDNAKKQRDEAKRKAQNASEQVDQLKKEKNQLSYAAALIAKQEALDEYINSQENLLNKRKQYAERISIMFAYENKSTLEILLESDSIAGFFTNLELIALIGDADLQMIDQLQIAMDDAELKNNIALQEAEDMQKIASPRKSRPSSRSSDPGSV